MKPNQLLKLAAMAAAMMLTEKSQVESSDSTCFIELHNDFTRIPLARVQNNDPVETIAR
jgi:hypothetical protein